MNLVPLTEYEQTLLKVSAMKNIQVYVDGEEPYYLIPEDDRFRSQYGLSKEKDGQPDYYCAKVRLFVNADVLNTDNYIVKLITATVTPDGVTLNSGEFDSIYNQTTERYDIKEAQLSLDYMDFATLETATTPRGAMCTVWVLSARTTSKQRREIERKMYRELLIEVTSPKCKLSPEHQVKAAHTLAKKL